MKNLHNPFMKAQGVDRVSQSLVNLALDRKTDDNVSVVTIHIRELSPAPRKTQQTLKYKLVSKSKEIWAMNTYAIILDKMLQIGDQFDHYQIQAHLAQGGMSDIYRAFDLVNRRDVAIKIPDQSIIGDPAQYERFQRELEVINTLDHPAILKGLGSGKYNRIPYLVTEFVDGRSLRTMIDEDAPIPPEKAILLSGKLRRAWHIATRIMSSIVI